MSPMLVIILLDCTFYNDEQKCYNIGMPYDIASFIYSNEICTIADYACTLVGRIIQEKIFSTFVHYIILYLFIQKTCDKQWKLLIASVKI